MKKILQYRLHVVLAAILLTLSSFPVIGLREIMVALAMGMAAAWVYLFNKTTDLVEDNINTASHPIDVNHRKTLCKIALACLAIPALWLWQMPKIFAVYLVFGGLLGFLYSYPIKIGEQRYRLKNIFLIKNITPALSWTGCTCLPVYFLYPHFPQVILLRQAISVFLVMTCVEIIWDIRDVEGDTHAGVQTLPNTIGIPAAKAVILLIFALYCFVSHYISPPLVLAQAANILIIIFATKTRPYWYFHLIVFIWVIYNSVILMQKI